MYSTVEKNELNAKTRETANDVRDGARRVKEDLRDAAGNVKSDLEDMARQAGTSAREYVASAEKSVMNIADSMTAKIYDKPLQSSAISLAIGVFIGLLFSARRS